MMPYAIALIADDPLARAGLAAMLDTLDTLQVTAQWHSQDAAAETFTAVDAIIWDLGWEPDTFIPEMTWPPLPTVVLLPPETAVSLPTNSEPFALLPRSAHANQIAAAVTAVMQGLIVTTPHFVDTILPAANTPETAVPDLTPRETEVLALLAEGHTNKAIAQKLHISDHTVKFHVNAIMGKLNAQSRTDAVVRATRLGLLTL
jgi:DNA-binding NarL/FixJ family response regulator